MASVYGNADFQRLLGLARTQKVDFVFFGDSNVRNYSAGHFRALELGLDNLDGVQHYASAYVPGGSHNTLGGAGDGARYKGSGWSGGGHAVPWGTSGAGATIDGFTGADDILHQEYQYLDTGEATTVGVTNTMKAEGATFTAGSTSLTGGRLIGNTFRFDYHCAQFSAGGGDLTIRRRGGVGGSEIKTNQTFGTTDGDVTTISSTQDTWLTGTDALFDVGSISTNHSDGKCALLGMRAVSDRTTGIAISAMYAVGGQSTKDAFGLGTGTVITQSDAYIDYYLDAICGSQTATKANQVFCGVTVFGHNENGDSVTVSDYKANLQRLVDKILTRWLATGRKRSNFFFWFFGPHGVSGNQNSAGNTLLRSLSSACLELAAANPGGVAVDLWELIGDALAEAVAVNQKWAEALKKFNA